MADVTIRSPLVQKPWYSPGTVLRNLWNLRQYPVIPIFILMIVLVIPAIFAELIAPFDPVESSLSGAVIAVIFIQNMYPWNIFKRINTTWAIFFLCG